MTTSDVKFNQTIANIHRNLLNLKILQAKYKALPNSSSSTVFSISRPADSFNLDQNTSNENITFSKINQGNSKIQFSKTTPLFFESTNYFCKMCQIQFLNELNLVSHLEIRHKLIFDKIRDEKHEIVKYEEISNTERSWSPEGKNQFICRLCQFVSYNLKVAKLHQIFHQ